MTASWARLMAALRTDPDVRCVVVTGAGSAFCSGGDTSWIGSEPDAGVDALRTRMLAFYRAWLSVRDLEVPTIAAINGAAIGAGLALALACDLRYAAEDARLGVPFTSLGMHAGMATTWLLPEVAGLGVARELLLTGRHRHRRGGRRARPGQPGLPARGAAGGVAGDRRFRRRDGAGRHPADQGGALQGGGHADVEAAMQWEALAQPVTLATADLQEGLRAARDKRPPRFTGR